MKEAFSIHTADRGLPAHWPTPWPHAPSPAPSPSGASMVVTTDEYASRVGLEILRQGGNAVDAAVAVHFALAVVNPEAGNLGGGGFLLFRASDGSVNALDFRSTAPAAATRDMFHADGDAVADGSVMGPRAAGVPGSVRGMWDVHRRFGRIGWSTLVAPAVELAEGFEVTERFVRSFEPHIVEGLRRFEASAQVFLPNGRPPSVGDVFVQADLARTLTRIRDRGPDGFYAGRTADRIVAEMQRGGGIVSHDDLMGYETVWRTPIRVPYRGHTVVSMPPPSSGGVTLAIICNMLSPFSVGDLAWHGPDHVHLMAEVWKRAFADRNHYLADPGFADVPAETLVDPQYGRWRSEKISLETATPAAEVGPGLERYRTGGHTTHFSIVDREGNAVSNTTTINTWYGSKAIAAGTGVLLNNDMDDFSTRPGAPNFFGLVQGEANVIEPGKRMLSAMTPTLVLDGEGALRLVVGAPGGATIITTVFQILSNLLDHGMSLSQAVCAPRVHHQHLPDHVRYEPGGLPVTVAEALRAKGHAVTEHHEMAGDAQVVLVDGSGRCHGQSDPRRGGVAMGE